jgi:hypothetical protein
VSRVFVFEKYLRDIIYETLTACWYVMSCPENPVSKSGGGGGMPHKFIFESHVQTTVTHNGAIFRKIHLCLNE